MPSVTFEHAGALRVECRDGESIFEVALRAGRPLPTACGGKASCGLCRVRIVAGAEFLSAVNVDERRHLGNVTFLTKLRLGCQARVTGGDVTVADGDGR